MGQRGYSKESAAARGRGRWLGFLREGLGLGLVICGLIGGLGVGHGRAETTVEPSIALTLKGTLLSAQLKQVPLRVVLTALARQADLTVQITAEDAQQVVSATFSELPLAEGIARLLQGKSYALITEPTVAAPGKPPGKRLAKIRVLSQGGTYTILTGHPPVPLVVNAPAAPLDDLNVACWKREAVEAPEPAKRIAALQALNKPRYLKKGGLQPVVEGALGDAVPEVRAVALEMLPTSVLEAEALLSRLGAVAQQDASLELRMQALMTLVETHDIAAQGYVQQALQDANQEVRAMAQELLELMAARARKAVKATPQPGQVSQP